MHVGIALKPSTPVEHVFPYCDAGDVDLVSRVQDVTQTMVSSQLRPKAWLHLEQQGESPVAGTAAER